MRFVSGMLAVGMVLFMRGATTTPASSERAAFPGIAEAPRATAASEPAAIEPAELTAMVKRTCVVCHNDQLLTGNLSLQTFDVAKATERAEVAEKMVMKLRLKMMPPPGVPRPGGDTLTALAETLEATLDRAAAIQPNPGRRSFQRLNRVEYGRSIEELLGITIDPSAYLPPDTKSDNFDNIADVQMASATVMDSYLTAASEISRKALGDPGATSTQATFRVSRTVSQAVHIDGTPWGTRGGLSVLHSFPADGEYTFDALFYVTLAGAFFGKWMRGEQLEVSIDGERVAMIEIDRFMHEQEPTGATRSSQPVFIRAGEHRVSAAFVKTFEGPTEDLLTPFRETMLKPQAGYNDGQTQLPHLYELMIKGPERVTGVSDTPARRRVFTCRPLSEDETRPCAQEIIGRLAGQAYRRPLLPVDLAPLMTLYEHGKAEGGFEGGIRTALEGILASPDFIFRWETTVGSSSAGRPTRINDLALASRLSFFVWGLPPDQELIQLAQKGDLAKPDVLERQVRRMLADPRSAALSTRFAAQWLRLQDLDKVLPTDDWPNFDRTLKEAMLRETEMFFNSIVREDRSVMDLLTADYTFVNEPLARHYGIQGIAGDEFQRVQLPDARRRGLLGQGSILVLTSHSDRTSPVLRGKWVMEVLLNSPPPPPPPNVPPLEKVAAVDEGRVLTVKERMEVHRASPVCRACHQFIDPLGVALENFDVDGAWRIKDAGNPLDPTGTLWDQTPLNGPADLRQALLNYKIPFLRAFTKNLLSYATGRRMEYFDQPTIRTITRNAEADGYRISSFVIGAVKSEAFRMTQLPAATTESN